MGPSATSGELKVFIKRYRNSFVQNVINVTNSKVGSPSIK